MMSTELSRVVEAVEGRVPDVLGIHPLITGISVHGWRRWCERSGETSTALSANRLRRVLGRAREVELKPRFRVAALCNHKFESARYFRAEGFVFVVGAKTGLLLTVHLGEAGRWQPMAVPTVRHRKHEPSHVLI